MLPVHRIELVLVTLALALSGCVGSGDAPARPASSLSPGADEGGLRVTVLDESEIPIAQAQVAVLDSDPRRTAVTDAAGEALFDHLAPRTYQVAAARLGYSQELQAVDIAAGEVAEVQFRLKAVEVPGIPRATILVGQGYIACGLYAGGVSVSNLNVCAWDTNHKPRFEFKTPREGLKGILQEVAWDRTSALTAEKMRVYLWYKPVCDPTCTGTQEYASANDGAPVRQYADLSKEKFEEEEVPLASMTFVGGSGSDVVLVFQQRIEHYVTTFHNAAPADWKNVTALPAS